MLRPHRQPLNAKSRTLEAALANAAKLTNIESYYPASDLDAMSDTYTYGMSLLHACEIAATAGGHDTLGMTKEETFRAAFSPRWEIRAAAGDYATIDLPGVLGNLANKFMFDGFMAVEHGYRDIAGVRSSKDFKQMQTYSLTSSVKYAPIGASGELKSADLGETSHPNQIQQYGCVIEINRRDIVNDDIDALSHGPNVLGRGAGLALNASWWTMFLSNLSNLFTSGNGNLITGGSSVLSATSLETANALFQMQTDPKGNPIGIVPSVLLVPPQLRVSAMQLAHQLTTASDSEPTNQQQSLFKVVSASYLANTTFNAAASQNAWWLLASPRALPIGQIAFLDGDETPVIESAMPDLSSIGIRFRATHGFGVAPMEYRAGVMSNGQ